MQLHSNNKGFTLIELIISIAITAIVLTMIMIFINGATHSFRKTNDDVNLQYEAQIAINQLATLAMEANKITLYTGTPTGETRYIMEVSGKFYAVIYIGSSRKLYLIQTATETNAATVQLDNDGDGTVEADVNSLLAEYVDEITISPLDSNSTTIEIKFSIGKDDYTVRRSVKLRNVAH